MNIMHSTSSSLPPKPLSLLLPPSSHLPPLHTFGYYPMIKTRNSHSIKFSLTPPNRSCKLRVSIGAANPSNQETVSIEFEDFVEKDWSFLETDDTNTNGQHMERIDRIISSGNIQITSKVLVSIGSEAFVDRVVQSSPCEQLFVVHDSLLILACIKESYDKVKCWQGELINLPEKWTAFDVVFLYFLPALPFELDQVLAALAKRCLPGARVVISHPQGRRVLEEQQLQHPLVLLSSLPEKTTLQNAAADHSFHVMEFVDEPQVYLAVLRFDQDS